MTAEGTACNGAGEAPTAEKAAAAGKSPAERDGEGVGGPFVIVDGDSDRGSDLGRPLDEDSPSEEEEDEVLGSNAAPGAPVDGGRGSTAGASAAAPRVRDRAAEEPEGGEEGEADALLPSGSDRGAGSDAPAADPEVSAKEGTKEDSAATDVVSELVAAEASGAEQKQESAATESCGHDGAPTKTESHSATTESEVHVDGNRGEESAATKVLPVVQSIGGPGAPMANEHPSADTNADSFEAALEPDDEIKSEKDAFEIVDLVGQGDARGEKDGADALQTNGHARVVVRSDSTDSGSEVHANETEGKESGLQEEGEPITAAVVGVVETAGKDLAGSVEESTEENVDTDEVIADASGKTESVAEKVEGEATCVINQVEDKMGKDGEGGLCDDLTDGVASNEEVKLAPEQGINETVPGVADLAQATEDSSQETLQDDELVEDGKAYPFVETRQENASQFEIAQVDETAAESNLKADRRVEANVAAPLLSQQNCDSSVETVNNEQLEASDVDQLNEIENDVAEAEVMQEVETDVSDAVPLQADAASSASTFHNESQPTELVDGGSFNHSSPLSTELEHCDHAHTEENRSREISDTTVGQLVSGASLGHGSAVVGEAELSSVTGDVSQDKPSDSTVDQGEPVTLNADEIVVDDVAEPSSATGHESAEIDKAEDISKKEDSSDIAGDNTFHGDQPETCNASTACDLAGVTSESLEGTQTFPFPFISINAELFDTIVHSGEI
jgi:hypothetical protein